ncbi:MAG: hypothetical protein IKQ35_01375 [Bacilli bacterium]|nr:hypothetical protein [Bacilli bacterium]
MLDRTNNRKVDDFLINSGQNYVDPNIKRFIASIPGIKSIRDLKDLGLQI